MFAILLKSFKYRDRIIQNEQMFFPRGGYIVMDNVEYYKNLIKILIETSRDVDYLIAVYTFASSYPDKSKKS